MMRCDPRLPRHVFQVQCTAAHHVSLVIGSVDQEEAHMIPLRPRGGGLWKTAIYLLPGRYRYCYHGYDGRKLTYIAPPGELLDGLNAHLHVEPADAEHAGQLTGPASNGAHLTPPSTIEMNSIPRTRSK